MYNSSRLMAAVLLVLVAGAAVAGPALVRVGASSYDELRSAITFKGTSIEIVGGKPGESYDLLVSRADLGAVQGSGLPVTVLCDDIDTRKGEVARDGQYQSYDEIKTTLRNWAASFPNIVMLDSIGPT